MIATFLEMKTRILRLLNDEVIPPADYGIPAGGTTYTAELLADAIRAALDAISSRVWKTGSFDISESLAVFDEVPSDCLEILSVFDNSLGKYIPRQQMMPGKMATDYQYGNSWLDVPYGSVSFGVALTKDKGARVYYQAAWLLPEDDSDTLEPPEYCQNAIAFYACSYCLLQQAAGISTIRQYNTKVDSGAPTDNPTNEMANYFLRRFDIELQRLPLKTKEQQQ
jgi:hypothetical protein